MKKKQLKDIIRKMIRESMEEDICGLCGQSGADKVPHPVYWPGEQSPGTPYVHADCEDAETERAFGELSQSERDSFIDGLIKQK